MKLRPEQDAFGQVLWEAYRAGEARELIERDDGCLVDANATKYLSAPLAYERRSLRLARGRVLDIGCGAGRHALWLQKRGHVVVGIDVSPGAVRLARIRGLRHARRMSLAEVGPGLGIFETIAMLGNGFGLVGGEDRARWLLRRFKRVTSPDALILAGAQNPYVGPDPIGPTYRRRGREYRGIGRQVRMRIRHRARATPWFDLLLVSPRQLGRLVAGTGWRIDRTYVGPGSRYVAVLRREPAARVHRPR